MEIKEKYEGHIKEKIPLWGILINTIWLICQGKSIDCHIKCQEEQFKLYSIGNEQTL